jgi:hypothetical protein
MRLREPPKHDGPFTATSHSLDMLHSHGATDKSQRFREESYRGEGGGPEFAEGRICGAQCHRVRSFSFRTHPHELTGDHLRSKKEYEWKELLRSVPVNPPNTSKESWISSFEYNRPSRTSELFTRTLFEEKRGHVEHSTKEKQQGVTHIQQRRGMQGSRRRRNATDRFYLGPARTAGTTMALHIVFRMVLVLLLLMRLQ